MLDSVAPPRKGTGELDAKQAVDIMPDSSSMRTFTDPMVQHAYDGGVFDGRNRIEPDDFSRYLQLSIQEDEVKARLDRLEGQESELKSELDTVRQQRETLVGLTVETESLVQQIDQTTRELAETERDLEAVQTARDKVRSKGPLVYSVIFSAAAITFMLADIVITRKIVADALELTGTKIFGLDEGWYFALALALLSVLLKPAYDRLVEDPYWEGRRRVFNVTIISTSILALATLIVLGIFRGAAFEAQTIGELQQQAPNSDPVQVWDSLVRLQEEVVRSWSGKLAFIMSGVLFAIAGAISLGIGLRYFHDWKQVRRPVLKQYRGLTKKQNRLQQKLESLVSRRAEKLPILRQTEIRLEIGPSVHELNAQLELIRDALPGLQEQYSKIRQDRLASIYANGHKQGSKLRDSTLPNSASKPRPKRPRPFIAIRREIRGMFVNTNNDAVNGV